MEQSVDCRVSTTLRYLLELPTIKLQGYLNRLGTVELMTPGRIQRQK